MSFGLFAYLTASHLGHAPGVIVQVTEALFWNSGSVQKSSEINFQKPWLPCRERFNPTGISLAQQRRHEASNASAQVVTAAQLRAQDGSPARPVEGPVLPLGYDKARQSEQLLADNSPALAADPDSIAVIRKGEVPIAKKGRADDFSWPRLDVMQAGSEEAEAACDRCLIDQSHFCRTDVPAGSILPLFAAWG